MATLSCHDSNHDPYLPVHRWCLLSVGNEVFAVHPQQVCEVVGVKSTVPIPDMSPVLVGVMAWKGLVIPLIDISVLLDHSRTSKRRYAALIKWEGTTIGIVVDEIPKISTGFFDAVHQNTIDGSLGGESIFRGVITAGAQQYRLLDIATFFAVLQSLAVERSWSVCVAAFVEENSTKPDRGE